MKVLIVEDEQGVAQNLCDILLEIEPNTEIVAIIESVEDAIHWINTHPTPDLGFFDIRIADGESFDIFERSKVEFPIIFTTAYDEYALKAFKVNSVDYLLKPINKNALAGSLEKYKHIYSNPPSLAQADLLQVIRELRMAQPKKFRKNFLVYIKDKILPISTDRIAYFFLEKELIFCITHQNEKYLIDQALDKIETQLNPEHFFRANRQYIVSRLAIKAAAQHFHRKLKLELLPATKETVLISKMKVGAFKKWLEM